MACAFIRSWWPCTFWMTSLMTLNQHKNQNYVISPSLKSVTMGKLINRIPGSHLLISSLPGLGFDSACWIARQASRCQQAFSKPCLVNLISKDSHLVFSISCTISCNKWRHKNFIMILASINSHRLQKIVKFRHFLRSYSDFPVLFEAVLIFNGFQPLKR